MTITIQQLIALLPLLIVGLTVVVVMLFISWRRNHLLSAVLSAFGLNTALAALWFFKQIGKTIIVTPLMLIDSCAILYTSLVLLSSFAVCAFAYSWLEDYKDNKEEFYLLILISTLGGIVLANTNHLTGLFLGVELISLPLFALIGYSFYQKFFLEASIKYMILSATASSFLLFGIALLYAETGNLSFIALSKIFNDDMLHKPLLFASIAMMTVGFGFKLSLVPFHLWTPDIYQGAPVPVSTFLATVSKISIFSVIMRLFLCFSMKNSKVIATMLGVISFLSIVFGNLMALSQTNIKRLIGYSSISHLGYLLIALVTLNNNDISMEMVGIYLINYLLSNIGIFGVMTLMSKSCNNSDVDSLLSYRGLFWKHPMLSTVITAMIFSLAGVPMTLGFIGKFYVLAVSIQSNLFWLTAGVLISSVISLYYYLRIVINLYLTVPQKFNGDIPKNWQYSASGIIVLISLFLVLIFGIYPQPLINMMQGIVLSI